MNLLFRLPSFIQLTASMLLAIAVHLLAALILFGPFNLSVRNAEHIELPPSIGVNLVSSPPSVRDAAWSGPASNTVVVAPVRPVYGGDAETIENITAADVKKPISAPSLLDELIVEHATNVQQRIAANLDTDTEVDLDAVQSYVFAMVKHIENSWSRPLSARSGMSVRVRIRMVPDGELVGVSLLEGSGDEAFDRSALHAIEHSAPLPVPKDIKLFDEYFRSLQLVFSPEDL